MYALESLCMRCGENGTTRLLMTKVPHFRELVVMAFDCPHCGERQPILLDLSLGDQDGIRDCAVCCRPIRIRYQLDDDRVTDFRADPG